MLSVFDCCDICDALMAPEEQGKGERFGQMLCDACAAEVAAAQPAASVKFVGSFPHGVERGQYSPTAVDDAKAAADFCLLQVGPNVIRWRDGRTERVTARQLAKLQAAHTWATDF